MKKCLPISLLISLLCFGATGCGETTSSSTGTPSSGNNPVSTGSSVSSTISTSSPEDVVVVTGVSIEYDGETTVLAGTNAKLKATVQGVDGGKVTWSSSNEDIAKVVNGTVSFFNVAQDTEVTITATSKDDDTKSASITFTVKYAPINFADSHGMYDNSLFLEDGTVEVDKGDSGLMINGVHGTRWYVEAEVTPLDLGTPDDQYPKFGFMTGESEKGSWGKKTLFYFVDAQRPATTNSWTSLGLVGQNDEFTNWDWNTVTPASVSGDNAFKKDEPTKMGLMRDGVNYYLYAGVGEGYGVVKHIINEHFAEDEATYAWFGGWQTAYTLANVSAVIGDAIDSKYTDATSITLGSYEQTLYVGDTYQLDYKLDTDMYNPSKLSFTSSDEAIATVSNTGLITAGTTDGTATITVAYEDVKVDFELEVTTDSKFKVELDGKMDDALWTDDVKKDVIKTKAGEQYVDFYAARNSKGVYIYGEYKTNAERNPDNQNDWWQRDNFEFRLVTRQDPTPLDPDQIWISSLNNGSHNAKDGYVSTLTLNEETNVYEMVFEIFVPYNDHRLTANAKDQIGLHWGTATLAGWTACNWWYTSNFDDTHIIYYYDETVCEEHAYSNYRVVEEASCAKDGKEERKCFVCGHVDVKVNPKGEHNYSEVISTIPSTCCVKGSQEVKCPGCGDTKTVELELNPGYHPYGATYADGKWSCCGAAIAPQTHWEQGSIWGDANQWSYLARGLKGDFVVTSTYTLEVNGIKDNWWKAGLAIVQHDLGLEAMANGRHGSCWVNRYDWWGWCDQWQSEDKLTQQWIHEEMGNWANINRDMDWTDAEGNDGVYGFESTMTNCTVEWKCTRTGTTVLNEFTFTATDGSVFTYWTKSTDIAEEKQLNLALASEFSRSTILSVTLAQPQA